MLKLGQSHKVSWHTSSSVLENSEAPTLFSAVTTPSTSLPLMTGAMIMFLVVYPVCLSTKSLNFGFWQKKNNPVIVIIGYCIIIPYVKNKPAWSVVHLIYSFTQHSYTYNTTIYSKEALTLTKTNALCSDLVYPANWFTECLISWITCKLITHF